MIKSIVILTIAILFNYGYTTAQTTQKQIEPITNASFISEVGKWFSAWELICKDVYQVNKLEPVEFVFFDDKYVYSTSNVTVSKGEIIKGIKLLDKSFTWKKSLHNNSITLPDKKIVPIGLMSFASEIKGKKNSSFFVMPLPSFWLKASVKSDELGLDNLITGIFLHEFSHSQQIRGFGKRIAEFEKNSNFEIDFSDDIVQNLFQKKSAYSQLYAEEVDTFYDASTEINKAAKEALVKKGISLFRKRHADFFTEKYGDLRQIDELFLTMEGFGQYTMYAWLTHKQGANLPSEIAVKGVRRGGKWWSQDEGLALFLILEKLSKPKKWVGKMLGSKTESVVNLVLQESKNK